MMIATTINVPMTECTCFIAETQTTSNRAPNKISSQLLLIQSPRNIVEDKTLIVSDITEKPGAQFGPPDFLALCGEFEFCHMFQRRIDRLKRCYSLHYILLDFFSLGNRIELTQKNTIFSY